MSDEPTDGELRIVNYIVGEAESGRPIFNHRLEQYYSGEWRAVRVYHEGSGANLSEVPQGRKPLPDEWFAERAQMQDRIKELEAKLAKAVELLWNYCDPFAMTDSDAATIAKLTGGKDE